MDKHNRWRSRQVAFRLSPEEADLLDTYVKLSGLTKQDYITRRLLEQEIVVQGNPRVFKALRNQMAEIPLCSSIQYRSIWYERHWNR